MNLTIGPTGITMNDQVMNLVKGWFVVYKDKTMVTENECDWSNVKKNNILILGLKWYDRFWTLSGQTSYIQFKRGSAPWAPGISGEVPITCEERCIGYYEGANKVVFRVNEWTGQMTTDVQEP